MFNLFKANFRKEYIEMKRYYPNVLATLGTTYFIFLAIFLGLKFVGNPISFEENLQYTIVSYVFWVLAIIAVNLAAETILEESMRGTIEQLFMSPFGMWRVMLSRIIAEVSLNSIIVIVLLFAAQLTSGKWLSFNPIIIPILIITLISMVGLGFMMAGLAIIFKRISQFLQILQFIIMGLAFIPLSAVPLLEIAPFVKGIDMVRTITIENYSLTDIPLIDFISILLNALIYLCLGLFVYFRGERIAKQKGLINQY